MRSPLRAAAVLGATIALLAMGTGTASAIDLPGLFQAAVSLEKAPRANQVVSGVQNVTGAAQATEGVLNVKMYVLKHGAEAVGDAEPVAAHYYDFPASPAEFAFDWDSAKTPAGTYDLVLIAQTATREARTEVLGLRVVRSKFPSGLPQSKPKAAKSSGSTRTTKPAAPPSDASTVTSLSHSTGLPVRTRVTRPVVVAPKVTSGVARGVQTEAFYETYGALPYAAEANAAILPAGLGGVRSATEAGGGLWPSLTASLVLLLTAAHIQRVLRQQALFTR